MNYESLHYKTFELLKVDQQVLAVSYEFTSQNNSRKWVIDRDWRHIEVVMEEFISHKKYLEIGHKESVDVAGDIQLEITTKACPSYLSKLFKVPSQILNDHILSIFVSHRRLQEKEEEVKAQENSQTKDIGKDVQKTKTVVKPTKATYTPSKNIQTIDIEEYVTEEIPPEAAKQYKSTKINRGEGRTSLDTIPGSSETASVNPIRKSANTKREMCLPSTTQGPSRKSPQSASISRKLTLEVVLPRQEEARDLFGLNNKESDVKPREATYREGAKKETPMGGKRKKIVLSKWLKPMESKCDIPPRSLQIMSPTRTKDKKRHKEKKESVMTETRSLIIEKNCRHLPVKDFLSSFKLVEQKMNAAISQFMENRVIPKIKEFHFSKYVDLITPEQTEAALDFLTKKYKTQLDRDYGRMLAMFMEYVVPEWIINLFMLVNEMNRSEASKKSGKYVKLSDSF